MPALKKFGEIFAVKSAFQNKSLENEIIESNLLSLEAV